MLKAEVISSNDKKLVENFKEGFKLVMLKFDHCMHFNFISSWM
jgi:hypothetical protein